MTHITKIRQLTKKQVQTAMRAGSLSGALKSLGVRHNDPRIRKVFISLLDKYEVPRSYDYMNNRMSFTKSELAAAVNKSLSITDVLNNLGFRNHGANYKTIKKSLIQWNINIDHFDRIRAITKNKKVYTKEEIFCKNSKYSRSSLALAAKRYNIFEDDRCSRCGIVEWNGETLSLQIDHINGVNTDNRIENLRLMCPNCHSQTSNFSGRKKRE